LICLPTCPITLVNATPRTFTFPRAAWLSKVPFATKIAFGRSCLDAPLLWVLSRFGITVQEPVTTPPEIGLHVGKPAIGSKVQNWLKKPANVLVSTLSEAV